MRQNVRNGISIMADNEEMTQRVSTHKIPRLTVTNNHNVYTPPQH